MADSVQTVFWEGGELNAGSAAGKVREAVLAVPLDRLLAKVVKIPSGNLDDPVAYAEPLLKAISPYPDEPLAVSLESLRETDDGRFMLAAALPESSADDIAEALDAAKVNVTRIDAIPFGRLPALLPHLSSEGGDSARRILLVGERGYTAAFVCDGTALVAVRAIEDGGDLRRELMLLLLEAEEIAGSKSVAEVVVASVALGADEESAVPDRFAGLDAFAPVRRLEALPDAVEGIEARSLAQDAINVLPASWREVLEETRFKRKMTAGFAIAGGIWLLAMAVLVGVPMFYDYRTERMNDRPAEKRLFNQVNEKVKQVKTVQAMSNHDQGGLETLRAVVSAMPAEEMELSRWNFKRHEKLTFSGSVPGGGQTSILQFKDNLANLVLSQISGLEEDGDTPFFADVTLPKGINTRAGRAATFDVECSFVEPEEED